MILKYLIDEKEKKKKWVDLVFTISSKMIKLVEWNIYMNWF